MPPSVHPTFTNGMSPTATNSDPLCLEELGRVEMLLSTFLESHQRVHALLKQMPARVDNLQVAAQGDEFCAEFRKEMENAKHRAMAAEAWLSRLSEALQAATFDNSILAEPAIETIRAHLQQSRETHDLLRNACEEVQKLGSVAVLLENLRHASTLSSRPVQGHSFWRTSRRLRHAGPMVFDCQPKRDPGVACSRFVGPRHSSSLSFKAIFIGTPSSAIWRIMSA